MNDNFGSYFSELLSHALADADADERDDLLAFTLMATTPGDITTAPKMQLIAKIQQMNAMLTKAMAQMMQAIVKKLNGVRGGLDLKHEHDSTGRIARDASGNKIVTQEAVAGFASQVLDIEDSMVTDMMDVEEDQKTANAAANAAAGETDTSASTWLDDATRNELAILADFLAKGFAFHVDTSDFVTHTTHPYAPFSTGDYNDLVDQINGFEQFFHYWKRTRERALDTLETGKATEKSNVATEVFDVDIPALEEVADGLLLATNGAAEAAKTGGVSTLDTAKEKDTQEREHLELKVNKAKAKIFREIGFMVKKLYRATREEYKHSIKDDLEETITKFTDKLQHAREHL